MPGSTIDFSWFQTNIWFLVSHMIVLELHLWEGRGTDAAEFFSANKKKPSQFLCVLPRTFCLHIFASNRSWNVRVHCLLPLPWWKANERVSTVNRFDHARVRPAKTSLLTSTLVQIQTNEHSITCKLQNKTFVQTADPQFLALAEIYKCKFCQATLEIWMFQQN